VQAGLPDPDNNCNAEIYCNDQFVELESLGPLTTLSSGGSVNHMETWDVFEGMDSLPLEVREAIMAS